MIDIMKILFAAMLIPSVLYAEIIHPGEETACPDAVYRGNLKITFADQNLSDQVFPNMVFFYGKKPHGKAGKNRLQLKSIMICSGTEKNIDIVTKYIGKHIFPPQGECGLYLNGSGKIENDTLSDIGTVKLHCKDNLVYTGEYSITAEQL
jgi:hypothetical protein